MFQQAPINIDAMVLEIEAERKQKDAAIETPEQLLLRTMRDDKPRIANSKGLYKAFMETFFYIRPKERGLERFIINTSQEVLLDAYWFMKEDTPFVRMNILKGRQQGMSTLIGAFAVMEMLLHPGTGALIATEDMENSGKNLYMMYETYLKELEFQARENMKHLPRSEWLFRDKITPRFRFGKETYLDNKSMFTVVGEKLVTSRTLQFIHLSEAAFYHHLDDCLGMMLQTLPKQDDTVSSMFIETTAKMYGNEHHDGWLASCAGKSAFLPLFLPWYIHAPYRRRFRDAAEMKAFEEKLGDSEDHPYGNEKELLKLDNSNAPWRQMWPGLDFKKYGYDNVVLENLKFRRFTIDELKGNINEFNRQYPSTPEMAFLSNSAHVLDMDAIRWYIANQQKEPEALGLLQKVGATNAKFVQQRLGILAIWEFPMPYREYIIGVDVAEGFDIGDFSCAYVICRMPFKIVARLRGREGRTIRLAELEQQLNHLGYFYNTAHVCVENNGSGMAVIEGLQGLGYPNQIPEDLITGLPSNRFGWRSLQGKGGTRDRGVNLLQEFVTNRQIGIPCEIFLDESHHFHYIDGRPQAARKGKASSGSTVGCYDDSIIAVVGALLGNAALVPAKTEEQMRQDVEGRKRHQEEELIRRKSKDYADYKRFL